MNYYVHNLSPMALEWGWFILPWYWLAYIGGFFTTYLGVMKLSLNSWTPLPKTLIHEYLSYGFTFLLLGGRLGYVLIYNLDYYFSNPMKVFAVWEGGMSFHGALLGIGLYTLYKSKKHNADFFLFTDSVSIFAPAGIFFGRISNFINGELAGRVSDVPWAVIFPKFYDSEPRHPSQLYEAIFEGLILFIILFLFGRVRLKNKGFCTGLFLSLYGLFRFNIEFFRNPDPQMGLYLRTFTMGQILCVVMAITGSFIIFRSLRSVINPLEEK